MAPMHLGSGLVIVIDAIWVPACFLIIAVIVFLDAVTAVGAATAHYDDGSHRHQQVDRVGIHESGEKFGHLRSGKAVHKVRSMRLS